MEYVETDGGARIPKIGLGTAQLDGEICSRIVREALDLGYRHLDTAEFYGNEAAIGEALERTDVDREEIFLTTKIWRSNLRREDALDAARASLDRLGVEYVDLLLIHWPHPRVPVAEPIDAMAQLRDAGRVRHLGVSNFTRKQLRETIAVSDAPIVADQVHYNPYADQSDLQRFCADRGIALTAYSPLARGAAVDDEVLEAIGREHGVSAAQVALRWLVQQESVVAIPRTSSVEHLRSNLDVFGFELTDEEMRRIEALDGGVRATIGNLLPSLVRSFPL